MRKKGKVRIMPAVSKTREMKSLKDREIIMQRMRNIQAESSKSTSSLRVPENRTILEYRSN